jgi:hypothetical protein
MEMSADQNATFKLHPIDSSAQGNIIPLDDGPPPSLFNQLVSYIIGTSIERVRVKVPVKEKVVLTFSSNTTLDVKYNIKGSKIDKAVEGSFEITEDRLGNTLQLFFHDDFGVGYKENGDVCINLEQPVKRDVSIKPTLLENGLDAMLQNTKSASCLFTL